MSTCAVCQKDSMEHSKRLWEMHKQVTICEFCDKSSGSHSEELWEMHKGTIEAARRKTRHKKLWTVQIGFGPKCPALLDKDFSYNSNLNMAEWLVPIYMSCTECGLFLGSIEEDYADMLGGMCLECFRKTQICFFGYQEKKEIENPIVNIWSGEKNPKVWL